MNLKNQEKDLEITTIINLGVAAEVKALHR